jgi:hypothetical protein
MAAFNHQIPATLVSGERTRDKIQRYLERTLATFHNIQSLYDEILSDLNRLTQEYEDVARHITKEDKKLRALGEIDKDLFSYTLKHAIDQESKSATHNLGWYKERRSDLSVKMHDLRQNIRFCRHRMGEKVDQKVHAAIGAYNRDVNALMKLRKILKNCYLSKHATKLDILNKKITKLETRLNHVKKVHQSMAGNPRIHTIILDDGTKIDAKDLSKKYYRIKAKLKNLHADRQRTIEQQEQDLQQDSKIFNDFFTELLQPLTQELEDRYQAVIMEVHRHNAITGAKFRLSMANCLIYGKAKLRTKITISDFCN